MCPCLELYMKCEISDITGNVQEVMFPCLGNVHEMRNFRKLRKCACQATFPKY